MEKVLAPAEASETEQSDLREVSELRSRAIIYKHTQRNRVLDNFETWGTTRQTQLYTSVQPSVLPNF